MAAKGSTRLAAILQKRMRKVKDFGYSPTAELGMLTNRGLILDSFPEETIEKGDFLVCYHGNEQGESKIGKVSEGNEHVLVLWAEEQPVVVGKVLKE